MIFKMGTILKAFIYWTLSNKGPFESILTVYIKNRQYILVNQLEFK